MAADVKPVYKAKDGREFDDPLDATQWNKVIAVQEKLRRVVDEAMATLGDAAKTADGEPLFDGSTYRPLWHIEKSFGLPSLRRVNLVRNYITIESEWHNNVHMVLYTYNHERGQFERYHLNQLYADKVKAYNACVEMAKIEVAELQTHIKQLKELKSKE
jgi:hypothetical protein